HAVVPRDSTPAPGRSWRRCALLLGTARHPTVLAIGSFRNDITLAGAEVPRDFVAVVGAAAQLDVLDRRLASRGARDDVMELHESARAATPSILRDEGAGAAVSSPHDSLRLSRDVSRFSQWAAVTARARRVRELPLRELLDEGAEGPVEDLAEIAAGDGVSQQILRDAQLLPRLRARREADLVTLRGQWAYDARSACGADHKLGRRQDQRGRGR